MYGDSQNERVGEEGFDTSVGRGTPMVTDGYGQRDRRPKLSPAVAQWSSSVKGGGVVASAADCE